MSSISAPYTALTITVSPATELTPLASSSASVCSDIKQGKKKKEVRIAEDALTKSERTSSPPMPIPKKTPRRPQTAPASRRPQPPPSSPLPSASSTQSSTQLSISGGMFHSLNGDSPIAWYTSGTAPSLDSNDLTTTPATSLVTESSAQTQATQTASEVVVEGSSTMPDEFGVFSIDHLDTNDPDEQDGNEDDRCLSPNPMKMELELKRIQ